MNVLDESLFPPVYGLFRRFAQCRSASGFPLEPARKAFWVVLRNGKTTIQVWCDEFAALCESAPRSTIAW